MLGFAWASWLKTPETLANSIAVRKWLETHGWAEYVNIFNAQAVRDMDTLLSLTQEDLRALGMDRIGDRRKFLNQVQETIDEMKKPNPVPSTSSAVSASSTAPATATSPSSVPAAAAAAAAAVSQTKDAEPTIIAAATSSTTQTKLAADEAPSFTITVEHKEVGEDQGLPSQAKTEAPTSPSPTLQPPATSQQSEICNLCYEKLATKKCVDCEEFFCDECDTEFHDSSGFKSHGRVPLTRPALVAKPPKARTDSPEKSSLSLPGTQVTPIARLQELITTTTKRTPSLDIQQPGLLSTMRHTSLETRLEEADADSLVDKKPLQPEPLLDDNLDDIFEDNIKSRAQSTSGPLPTTPDVDKQQAKLSTSELKVSTPEPTAEELAQLRQRVQEEMLAAAEAARAAELEAQRAKQLLEQEAREARDAQVEAEQLRTLAQVAARRAAVEEREAETAKAAFQEALRAAQARGRRGSITTEAMLAEYEKTRIREEEEARRAREQAERVKMDLVAAEERLAREKQQAAQAVQAAAQAQARVQAARERQVEAASTVLEVHALLGAVSEEAAATLSPTQGGKLPPGLSSVRNLVASRRGGDMNLDALPRRKILKRDVELRIQVFGHETPYRRDDPDAPPLMAFTIPRYSDSYEVNPEKEFEEKVWNRVVTHLSKLVANQVVPYTAVLGESSTYKPKFPPGPAPTPASTSSQGSKSTGAFTFGLTPISSPTASVAGSSGPATPVTSATAQMLEGTAKAAASSVLVQKFHRRGSLSLIGLEGLAIPNPSSPTSSGASAAASSATLAPPQQSSSMTPSPKPKQPTATPARRGSVAMASPPPSAAKTPTYSTPAEIEKQVAKQLNELFGLAHPTTGVVLSSMDELVLHLPTPAEQVHALRGYPHRYGWDQLGEPLICPKRLDVSELTKRAADRTRRMAQKVIRNEAQLLSEAVSALGLSGSTRRSLALPLNPNAGSTTLRDEPNPSPRTDTSSNDNNPETPSGALTSRIRRAIRRAAFPQIFEGKDGKKLVQVVDLVLAPHTMNVMWSEHCPPQERGRLLRVCRHCNKYFSEDQNNSRACAKHPEKAISLKPNTEPIHPCCGAPPFTLPPRKPLSADVEHAIQGVPTYPVVPQETKRQWAKEGVADEISDDEDENKRLEADKRYRERKRMRRKMKHTLTSLREENDDSQGLPEDLDDEDDDYDEDDEEETKDGDESKTEPESEVLNIEADFPYPEVIRDIRDRRCAPTPHEGIVQYDEPVRLRSLTFPERLAQRAALESRARLRQMELATQHRRQSAVLRAEAIRTVLETRARILRSQMKRLTIHVFDSVQSQFKRVDASGVRNKPWFTITQDVGADDEQHEALWVEKIWPALVERFKALNPDSSRRSSELDPRLALSLAPINNTMDLDQELSLKGEVDIVLHTFSDNLPRPAATDTAGLQQLAQLASKWRTTVENGTIVRICNVCKKPFQNTKSSVSPISKAMPEDAVADAEEARKLADEPVGCSKYELDHAGGSAPAVPIAFTILDAIRIQREREQKHQAEAQEQKFMNVESLTSSLVQAYEAFTKNQAEATEADPEVEAAFGDDDADSDFEFDDPESRKVAQHTKERLAYGQVEPSDRPRGWRLYPNQIMPETPVQIKECEAGKTDRSILLLRVYDNRPSGKRRGRMAPPLFIVPIRITPTMTIDLVKHRVAKAWAAHDHERTERVFDRDFTLRHPVTGQLFVTVTSQELENFKLEQSSRIAMALNTELKDHQDLQRAVKARAEDIKRQLAEYREQATTSGLGSLILSRRRQSGNALLAGADVGFEVDEFGPGEALARWADTQGRVDVILNVGPPGSEDQKFGLNTEHMIFGMKLEKRTNVTVPSAPFEIHATRNEALAARRKCWRCGISFCLRDILEAKGRHLCKYHKMNPVAQGNEIYFPCCNKRFPKPSSGSVLQWRGPKVDGPTGEPLGFNGPEPCCASTHFGKFHFPLRYMVDE